MIKVIDKELELLLDPESKLPYEAEGYRLEDGSLVIWDHKSQSWRDPEDRIYTAVNRDNELIGFNRV